MDMCIHLVLLHLSTLSPVHLSLYVQVLCMATVAPTPQLICGFSFPTINCSQEHDPSFSLLCSESQQEPNSTSQCQRHLPHFISPCGYCVISHHHKGVNTVQ